MDITTIQDKLLFTTFLLKTGMSSATGFAYKTEKNNLIIISNRHFAEQTDDLDFKKTEIEQKIWFPLHLMDRRTLLIEERIKWHLHPSEDLAFFDLTSLLNKLKIVNPMIVAINKSNIPSESDLEGLDVVNDVLMIGYPNGLCDDQSFFPLYRVGKTAFHPLFDFCGRKHGLVDMACLPGSSGSPIFIYNDGTFLDKKNNATVVGSRLLFLGIEFSMPIRFNQAVYKKTSIPNNLALTDYVVAEDINYGNYIKSSQIFGFSQIIDSLCI